MTEEELRAARVEIMNQVNGDMGIGHVTRLVVEIADGASEEQVENLLREAIDQHRLLKRTTTPPSMRLDSL